MEEKSESSFQSFAVVGAGPVGCVVAGFLAKAGYEVTLCDIQPELIESAITTGIVVEGAEELTQAVSNACLNVEDLEENSPDVIFLTVKANALPLIASTIEGFSDNGTYVVSWQNGIDTELAIADSLGRNRVMRAVVNYGCELLKPGHVHMAFHHPPHYIQELSSDSSHAAVSIAECLTKSGLVTERTDKIVSMVWRKSIMNSSMNPVCAMTGMTMAQAIDDPIVFKLIEALLKEGIIVARANEINLGWEYYPYCMEYLKNAGDHKPSMLMDLEMGRRTEIDFINGKIIEYGKRAGLETPYNETLMVLVKALESKGKTT